MKLRILKSFRDKLNEQVEYIAKDKPGAARRFKTDVLKRIKEISAMPYACRRSTFFDREEYGPYKMVRHPNFAGLICMNIAYLLFFRTLYLVPFICIFVILWYIEAKHEERVLLAKFGDSYLSYMKSTAMFFPNMFR